MKERKAIGYWSREALIKSARFLGFVFMMEGSFLCRLNTANQTVEPLAKSTIDAAGKRRPTIPFVGVFWWQEECC